MKIKQLLTVAVVSALTVGCGSKGGMNLGDNEYPVATVAANDASMSTNYPAIIKGIQDVEIRPKVSGFITKVCVKEGQQVGAGQLLFIIDNATYQGGVRQAQAAINTAKAQLNTAKMTYENNKSLFEKNVIGQYELSTAQNNYQTAQAQLAQAQAALAIAQEQLSYCYVKSPAAGIVGTLPYKQGALVGPSITEPMTTVSDISAVEAYFSMTEKAVLELTKTQGTLNAAIKSIPTVKLKLADGSIYNHPGEVTKVSGVVDAATGSVQMIARFANPEHLIKSGSSGSIVLPYTSENAIIVPQSVVAEVQNKHFVYVVGKDNKVKYTEIKVDPQNDGETYIVREGLKIGDRYVTHGITKLNDQMEIKPISEAQYQKKIKDAEALGKNQSSPSGFAGAMK